MPGSWWRKSRLSFSDVGCVYLCVSVCVWGWWADEKQVEVTAVCAGFLQGFHVLELYWDNGILLGWVMGTEGRARGQR